MIWHRGFLAVVVLVSAVAVAGDPRQAVGQGDATPTADDRVPFSECRIEPRTPDGIYAIINAVLADNDPPATADGPVAVDAGVLTADAPTGTKPPDVRLDGALWIEAGALVGEPAGAQAGQPVDPATAAEVRASLRVFVACSYASAILRRFALYTDVGLEQFFRYLRPYLRGLASIVEVTSAIPGEDVYGTPQPEYAVFDQRLLSDGRVAALVVEGGPPRVDAPETPGLFILERTDGLWRIDWVFYGQFVPVAGSEATPVAQVVLGN